MSDKIDNCFIDELENYNYDINDESGKYLASAKTQSQLDISAIQKAAFTLVRNDDGSPFTDPSGMPVFDIDVHIWELQTIHKSLTKWKWDRDITIENISKLPKKIIHHLFREIRKHEGFFESNQEGIVKN